MTTTTTRNSSSGGSTVRTYRNNPYAFDALPKHYADVAVKSCFALYATPSPTATTTAAAADAVTTTQADDVCKQQQQQQQQLLFSLLCNDSNSSSSSSQRQDKSTHHDSGSHAMADVCDGDDDVDAGGVSETSSECGNSNASRRDTVQLLQHSHEQQQQQPPCAANDKTSGGSACPSALPDVLAATTTSSSSSSCLAATAAASLCMLDASTSGMPLLPRLTVFRYASVDFRFGSAWFLAPFRTFVGDMVVVEYAGNHHRLHMGLVSCITTTKPHTFYSDDNDDPNYLSDEELRVLPRLLRHARDHDRETKLELRRHDLRALANARSLAAEMAAPVTFLDAEWLLDLSAITFLVHVYGDVASADRLADELAAQEGAEVVFTYPAVNTMPAMLPMTY